MDRNKDWLTKETVFEYHKFKFNLRHKIKF